MEVSNASVLLSMASLFFHTSKIIYEDGIFIMKGTPGQTKHILGSAHITDWMDMVKKLMV